MATDKEFSRKVMTLVALIPKGRVMTYGQIAALCGQPRAARIVGGIAHFGPEQLPWQRVVNKHGGLATGYPGGQASHARDLKNDGVKVVNNTVNVNSLIWWPKSEF